MQKFDDISVSLKGNLAFVEIHRPPNNFFDAFLIQQIAEAYEALDEEDECRVIILKSEGKNFCAGANFGEDEDMLDKSVPYKKLYAQAVRLFRTKKPIIAVVQGAAVGCRTQRGRRKCRCGETTGNQGFQSQGREDRGDREAPPGAPKTAGVAMLGGRGGLAGGDLGRVCRGRGAGAESR